MRSRLLVSTVLGSFAALAGIDTTLFKTKAYGQFGLPEKAAPYRQAPGVVLEAEQMLLAQGFEPVRMGQGNLLVDTGALHALSGERVALVSAQESGQARGTVHLPEKGAYRLWVRYEHVPGTSAPFLVRVTQGSTRFEKSVGEADAPRYAPGDLEPRTKHPHTTDAMGLYEEAFTVEGLEPGQATVELVASPQPPEDRARQTARSVDLVVFTRDLKDTWRAHHARQTPRYPILDLARDLQPARWEARFRHQAGQPASPSATHLLTRQPWGASTGPLLVRGDNTTGQLPPGQWSEWVAIPLKDTTGSGMTVFNGPDAPMEVEIRPAGGGAVTALTGRKTVRAFLPPYPAWNESPLAAESIQENTLKALAESKAPGKKPTLPLVFGGNLPVGAEGAYGLNYARLHHALGLVAWHPGNSGAKWREHLKAAGAPEPQSAGIAAQDNAPLPHNVEPAKLQLQREGLSGQAAWYDHGDDWNLASWVKLYLDEEVSKARDKHQKQTPEKLLNKLWVEWLQKNRATTRPQDYWLASWGIFDRQKLKPDASAEVARSHPALYLDSLAFYEDLILPWLADGAMRVRRQLGKNVRVGGTLAVGPEGMLDPLALKLVNSRATDWVRPAGPSWRHGLYGSVAAGLLDEDCRALMRANDRGLLRAQIPATSPGAGTDDFLREAFTHLAHGARAIDLAGVGMEETQPEQHIDHRDQARFRAVRDLTHAIGFAEDLLADCSPAKSPVALLLSETTLRWDVAGIARERGDLDWKSGRGGDLRTTFQLDRQGIHAALTALGTAPDVVLEGDCTPEGLAGRKLLVVVGDCLTEDLANKLDAWVRQGGTVLATASAGRFDAQRKPHKAFDTLLGLAKRVSAEKDSLVRSRWELPALTTVDAVAGPSWFLPALAIHERVEPAEGTEVVARFQSDNSPAVCFRRLGEGKVISVSAMPGLAALWTASQPGEAPDLAAHAQKSPVKLDPGARHLLEETLQAAGITPPVRVDLEAGKHLVDTRLLESEKGCILPLVHHGKAEPGPVTVRVRLPKAPARVTSAWHGEVPCAYAEGEAVITLPSLAAVDLLRIEPGR